MPPRRRGTRGRRRAPAGRSDPGGADGDTPPLVNPRVTLSGPQTLLLAATMPPPLTLYYGNRVTRRAVYDLERLRPQLTLVAGVPVATVGDEVENPRFRAADAARLPAARGAELDSRRLAVRPPTAHPGRRRPLRVDAGPGRRRPRAGATWRTSGWSTRPAAGALCRRTRRRDGEPAARDRAGRSRSRTAAAGRPCSCGCRPGRCRRRSPLTAPRDPRGRVVLPPCRHGSVAAAEGPGPPRRRHRHPCLDRSRRRDRRHRPDSAALSGRAGAGARDRERRQRAVDGAVGDRPGARAPAHLQGHGRESIGCSWETTTVAGAIVRTRRACGRRCSTTRRCRCRRDGSTSPRPSGGPRRLGQVLREPPATAVLWAALGTAVVVLLMLTRRILKAEPAEPRR